MKVFRIIAFFLALWPMAIAAQEQPSLVADHLAVTEQTITATGNVTAWLNGTRIKTEKVVYDADNRKLDIPGAVLITQPDGTSISATQASLSTEMQTGLIIGARVAMDQYSQIVAARATRDGALLQLDNVMATSCNVCQGQAPLWEIRAKQAVHDRDQQRIWYSGAQFRVKGVPIMYFPRLSLPDPNANRASGMLQPELIRSDTLGYGVKLPWFFTIGQSKDLTVTPWITEKSRSVNLRYRQMFENGSLTATGMISHDNFTANRRGYLFAEGAYALADGFQLSADLELVTDAKYLSDYGINSKTRLDSELSIDRIKNDNMTRTNVTFYETLRKNESNQTLPAIETRLEYDARTPLASGIWSSHLGITGLYRRSDIDGDKGRDMLRFSGASEWSRQWVFGPGFEFNTEIGARLDHYFLKDSGEKDKSGSRVATHATTSLGWPLIRKTANAIHIVEPKIAFGWSQASKDGIPNEDSTATEFDEFNLYSLDYFAGNDAISTGFRASAGLSWTMQRQSGLQTRFSVGRVYHANANDSFSIASGLQGKKSGWLVSGSLDLSDSLTLDNRTLFLDNFSLARTDTRFAWDMKDLSLSATHAFVIASEKEGRAENDSELALSANWNVNNHWALRTKARYDLTESRARSALLGVTWRNECVRLDLSRSLKFTSNGDLDPDSTYGLQIAVEGFSTSSNRARARACRQ